MACQQNSEIAVVGGDSEGEADGTRLGPPDAVDGVCGDATVGELPGGVATSPSLQATTINATTS